MPVLKIKADSWTRESHGLYDFEGSDIVRRTLSMYSSGWLNRAESSVEVTPFAQGAVNFEAEERALSPEQQQLIIARVLYSEGSYWLFHRPLVDETTAAVLERRPEERVWLVVKA